jgi:hypothetical protein
LTGFSLFTHAERIFRANAMLAGFYRGIADLSKCAICQPRPPRVCHKPKLPGLPHCFGTGRTRRQLPRSFEGFISPRVQIQNVSLFGLHIVSET